MYSLQESPLLFQAFVGLLFGLIVGSFLNVVVYRIPRGRSIAFPGSACGACGAGVKPYDNIPVLSYLILGGKCRFCKTSISWVYPAVELLTGLLFAGAIWKFQITPLGIASCVFIAFTVALIFIDYRHQLLPNVLTFPLFLIVMGCATFGVVTPGLAASIQLTNISISALPLFGTLILAISAVAFYGIDLLDNALFGKYMELTEEEDADDDLREVDEAVLVRQHNRVVYPTIILGLILAILWLVISLAIPRGYSLALDWGTADVFIRFELLTAAFIGAVVGAGLIWFLRAAYFWTRGFGGMGLGDVKLMAIIGAFLGWQQAILVLIVGSFAGAIFGVLQMYLGRGSAGLKTKLAFGIFLGSAAIASLFYGQPLIRWYVGTLG